MADADKKNPGSIPAGKKNNKNGAQGKLQYVEKEVKRVDVWRLKPYLCKAKVIDIKTGKMIIVLNEKDAREHDIYSGYRTEIKHGKYTDVAIVDVSEESVKPGEVGIFADFADEHGIKNGEKIEVLHLNRPDSIEYIRKKLDGITLTNGEIKTIVDDIMEGKLSEIETASWVSSVYVRGLSDDEIVALTDATVNSGDTLNLGKAPIVDKHCIGGVAGNRTTMVMVPIIAAAKFYIPKTSSRAITSPSGTADTMEVLAPVNFKIDELRDIVKKTYGAIVWGGGLKLAPVDDKLIRVRHPLALDPEGMLLASILGKKKSVGAQYVLVDIPVGRGAKVPYVERGQELARHFIKIGQRIGMKIEAVITDGAEPVGNGIGPGLECRDVLQVLEGKGPEDLRHKSCMMTGKLLELCESCSVSRGYDLASQLLENGKALAKMREIIEMQGGDAKIKSSDIHIGQYTYDVTSDTSGQIFHIDNKVMSKIARLSGAPMDKGAGVYLHRVRGERVEKGDRLFTIYAESEQKLSFAIKALENLEPIEMRKMLLGTLR
jgi:AMP phosphorylase